MARLVYGCGLRLQECLQVRIKDIDLEREALTVRSGKGDKDRETVLPVSLKDDLKAQIERSRSVYEQDPRQKRSRRDDAGCLGKEIPEGMQRMGMVLGFPIL